MISRRPHSFILAGFVIIYIGVLSSYCYSRFLAFGYYDWDLAVYAQSVWNITRWDFFSSLLGVNFFGHHAHFLAFPTAVIYKCFPTPLTLLFLQTTALGMAAFPLYLLAQKFLDRRWALIISCLYLVHQGVVCTGLYEFHFTSFAPLIFFTMFYFFFIEKYAAFLVFTLLSLLCQENFALLVFTFSLLAMFKRRSVRWWLPSMAGSVLYFIFCIKFLFPHLNADTVQFISIYSHWGSGYGEILFNLFSQPFKALQYMFTPLKLEWLRGIFSPLFFIPLIGPEYLLVAVPVFLQRLLSNRTQEIMYILHYQAEILPFVFLAMVFGVQRILSFPLSITGKYIFRALLVISVLVYACFGMPRYMSSLPGRTKITNEEKIKDSWVRGVPPGISAVASFEFLSHLTNRKDLYSFHYIYTGTYILSSKPYVLNKPVDIALVDFNDPFLIGSFYYLTGYKKIREFLDHQQLFASEVANNMVLFRRGSESHKILYQELDSPPLIPKPLNIEIDDTLRLGGYNVQRKDDRLELILYWQVLKQPLYDLASVFIFSDPAGSQSIRITSPACYRIFPTQAWQGNTWVVEYKYLLIPSDFILRDFLLGLTFEKYGGADPMPFFKLTNFKGE